MRYLTNILLKVLAAVLPVAVTIYLVYWFGVSLERVLQPVITSVIPERFYWSGMGVIVGLVLLFFIGLMVNAWLVRNLFQFGENLIERIPLIKSIYSTLRDFVEYLSTTESRKNLSAMTDSVSISVIYSDCSVTVDSPVSDSNCASNTSRSVK